jgi:hypothetical protein
MILQYKVIILEHYKYFYIDIIEIEFHGDHHLPCVGILTA